MISAFDIFRIVIGVIVFIFVITFFLRFADMYSGTASSGKAMEAVNAFEDTAQEVYASGNPSSFSGFQGFRTLAYDPPKIMYDSGQKTLAVPTLLVPSTGKLYLESRCAEFGWFGFCWVYAFPEGMRILFTFVDDSPASRQLARQALYYLPDSAQYGFCSSGEARAGGKADFISFLSGPPGAPHQPCNATLPQYTRVIAIAPPPGLPPGSAADLVVDTGAGLALEGGPDGAAANFTGPVELAVLVTGGKKALDYVKQRMSKEVTVSARIMMDRTRLVSQKMVALNRQPCVECATPFPEACGWTDSGGRQHASAAYEAFGDSLDALARPGDIWRALNGTAQAYGLLESEGCE